MRAVDGTAGVARVELVCPHWGVSFCKHRSWVALSAACHVGKAASAPIPMPSAAWSQEASGARTPPPAVPFLFRGPGITLGPMGFHDLHLEGSTWLDLVQTL